MSKVKRILSVIMAMVMVLAMSVPTFAAANVIGDKDDTAVIGVTNVGANATKVTAYPVIVAKYQSESNDAIFTGYEVKYTTTPAIRVNEDGEYTLSAEQIAQIRASLNASEGVELVKQADGTTWSKALPIGAYLIIVSNEETATYNAMVASTNYKKDESGKNTIDMAKATATAKKVTAPELEKKIVETKEGGSTEKVNGNTANIGDKVEYEVTVKNIPNYDGKYPVFNVEDTLSTGLTYNNDVTISVKDETTVTPLDKNTYCVDTSAGQKITLNFVADKFKTMKPYNGYSLKAYNGQTLVIKYSATVNENAAVNEPGNNNDAIVSYAKDSSVQGTPGTSEDKTYTYTFDIDGGVNGSVTDNIITKVGIVSGETTNAPLEGATFTLYTDDKCTEKYSNAKWNGVVSTDTNGQMLMEGLKAGTYYLKETAAPNGFTLNDTVYRIVIAETLNENGKLESWTITINGDTIIDGEGNEVIKENKFTVDNKGVATKTADGSVDIINTKISSLPSTGGIGTTIFTIGGCAIMIVAAGLFFATRRKTQK
ncbi:isopeptide-forming domain-containing fimbrial protein [Oliverpabstia intestinalis]|uniref:isopeptide-forming domain-containing fimbrial protein n=1 Tax=Oliverpabstia intestinalis TaxID=2606633 RepID=UPI003F892878